MTEREVNHPGLVKDESGGLPPAPNELLAAGEVDENGFLTTGAAFENPFRKPKLFNLATDYGKWDLTDEQAWTVLNRKSLRFGYEPAAIFLHIQQGITRGSLLQWVKVKASSGVMVEKNGNLLRVIEDAYAPWTNGEVNQPSQRGLDLLQRFPGANPNQYSLTIEMEGSENEPLSGEALETLCWMCAEWFGRHSLGIKDIYGHADVDSVNRYYCPGNYIQEVKARLREEFAGH